MKANLLTSVSMIASSCLSLELLAMVKRESHTNIHPLRQHWDGDPA